MNSIIDYPSDPYFFWTVRSEIFHISTSFEIPSRIASALQKFARFITLWSFPPQNSKVNALCGGSHPVPSILHPARLKGLWLHPQGFFSNSITDFSYPHCFPFVPLCNCYTLLIQECFSLDGKPNFYPNRQFVHLRLVILVKRIFVMRIFGSLINFEEKVLFLPFQQFFWSLVGSTVFSSWSISGERFYRLINWWAACFCCSENCWPLREPSREVLGLFWIWSNLRWGRCLCLFESPRATHIPSLQVWPVCICSSPPT